MVVKADTKDESDTAWGETIGDRTDWDESAPADEPLDNWPDSVSVFEAIESNATDVADEIDTGEAETTADGLDWDKGPVANNELEASRVLRLFVSEIDKEALPDESATDGVEIALDGIDTTVADWTVKEFRNRDEVPEGLVEVGWLARLDADAESEPEGLPEENTSEIAEVAIDETDTTGAETTGETVDWDE